MQPASAEQRGHEPSAISLRGVLACATILVVALALVLWILSGVYDGMMRREERHDRPASALTEARSAPPEPRLQPFGGHQLPHEDLKKMRDDENLEFSNRGWIDPKTGDVRVPDDVVERVTTAMSRGATTQGVSK